MSYIRPFPVTNNESNYVNNLASTVNSQNVTVGKGLRIRKTSEGIQLYAHSEPHKDYQSYQGVYGFTNEYFPNDTVYVPASSSYTDQNGNPLTITPGYYGCLVYVPGYDSNFFLNTVVPVYNDMGQAATDYDANAYRWYTQNTYYPNTTYSGSANLINVSGYNIQSNVQFWQFLGGGSISGSVSSGWNWRGLYTPSPAYPYMANDVVMESAGVSAIYWNYDNNNNSAPATGTGWSALYSYNVNY